MLYVHQGFFIAPQLVTESQAKAFKNAFIHACSDKQDNTKTRLKSSTYSRKLDKSDDFDKNEQK